MAWLTSIAFMVALLETASSHVPDVLFVVPTTFNNPISASGFLECLTSGIGSSPAFPSQEQKDIETLAKDISRTVSTKTGAIISARAQALTTALVLTSYLTDLLLSESSEGIYYNQLLTFTSILSDCSVNTTGSESPLEARQTATDEIVDLFREAVSPSLVTMNSFSRAFSRASTASGNANVANKLGLFVAAYYDHPNRSGFASRISELVSAVGMGARPRAYADAISNVVAEDLIGRGLLTRSNVRPRAREFVRVVRMYFDRRN